MKTITGMLVVYALAVPPAPAAAQGHLQREIERIVDSALTLAADSLDELVEAREQTRADRIRERQQRERDRARADRGPEYTDTFTRTVRLGRTGRLELDNLSGDVEITGADGDDVKITATKRLRSANETSARSALAATEIEVVERPGFVRISVQPTRGRSASPEVDYVITLPTGTNIAVKTASGDLVIQNVTGDVQLNSLSGDVVVRDAKPRTLDVEVVSGDIDLEGIESERVRAKSTSGDVIYRGKVAKAGRYDLSTNSGDVEVATDADASFDVEAGTFSGEVTSDFPLKLRGSVGSSFAPGPARRPGRSTDIRGTANDGGALLLLRSLSGDIVINRR